MTLIKKTIRNIIKESAGIAFPVRDWSSILYKKIISNPDEDIRLIIDGYDYPKIFEWFQVDYFVIDYHPNIVGYIPEYSGYDKDGNYVVVIYITKRLVSGLTNYSLQSALNHELKHAYEDYNRIKSGYSNIDTTKESKSFYTKDFINYLNSGGKTPLKNILKDYYNLSDIEISAYLENIYDGDTQYEREVRDVLNKDYYKILNHPNIELEWFKIKSLDIPYLNKFNSLEDFIEKSNNKLKLKANKVLKKINKMKYVHDLI